MPLAEDMMPCTVCGEPNLWGSRHHQCGTLVMALLNIAMYGDRGNERGTTAKIEEALHAHLAATHPKEPTEATESVEWLLYEHDDGRHAVAPSVGVAALAFTAGEPGWHRVGPVAAYGVAAATDVKEPTEAREASAEGGALSCPKCGAANADDAGDLCIGEDCPVQQSDDFDEALRIYHGTPAPGMVEEPSSKEDGRG